MGTLLRTTDVTLKIYLTPLLDFPVYVTRAGFPTLAKMHVRAALDLTRNVQNVHLGIIYSMEPVICALEDPSRVPVICGTLEVSVITMEVARARFRMLAVVTQEMTVKHASTITLFKSVTAVFHVLVHLVVDSVMPVEETVFVLHNHDWTCGQLPT